MICYKNGTEVGRVENMNEIPRTTRNYGYFGEGGSTKLRGAIDEFLMV